MKSKYFNYLLFTSVGLICAEFLSLSMPLTLIFIMNYWGYGLIYILLLHIIKKYDLRDFKSYYLLGLFIGILTETFLTKVLYHVPWRQNGLYFLGFGVIDSLMLLFFWHPVMSFAVPVLICNYYFGYPNPNGLIPERYMKLILGVLPIILALMSVTKPNLVLILTGTGINFVVLTVYIMLFKKFKSDNSLLSTREIITLILLIVVSFTFAYFTLVDYFPSIITLVFTFAIIGFFFVLNYLNITRKKIANTVTRHAMFSWRGYLTYCFYFSTVFFILNRIFSLIYPLWLVMTQIVWYSFMIAGTLYFITTCSNILKKKST